MTKWLILSSAFLLGFVSMVEAAPITSDMKSKFDQPLVQRTRGPQTTGAETQCGGDCKYWSGGKLLGGKYTRVCRTSAQGTTKSCSAWRCSPYCP